MYIFFTLPTLHTRWYRGHMLFFLNNIRFIYAVSSQLFFTINIRKHKLKNSWYILWTILKIIFGCEMSEYDLSWIFLIIRMNASLFADISFLNTYRLLIYVYKLTLHKEHKGIIYFQFSRYILHLFGHSFHGFNTGLNTRHNAYSDTTEKYFEITEWIEPTAF